MKRKIVCIFVLTLLFATLVPMTVTADETFGKTITVNDDGGADYTRIQDAIDNASDGDTIYVYGGIYHENLIIDKSVDVSGEDRSTTIVEGDNLHNVVTLMTNGITFTGFTVRNSGNTDFMNCTGIFLTINSINCHVSDCIISNNYVGLRIFNSYNNCVSNCVISDNEFHGILITFSLNNQIYNCTVVENTIIGGYGICLSASSYNEFAYCNISSNGGGFGVILFPFGIFTNFNKIHHVNFINNKVNIFNQCLMNNWDRNYYDDWMGVTNENLAWLPYHIRTGLFTFDWHPAKEPYDITAGGA